jgi:hypothetical protein
MSMSRTEDPPMQLARQEKQRICSRTTMRLFIAFAAAGIALICVFYYDY